MWQWIQPARKYIPAVFLAAVFCLAVINYVLIPQFYEYRENKSELEEILFRVKVAESIAASYKSEGDLAAMTEETLDGVRPLFNNDMGDGLALVYIGLEAIESGVQVVSFRPLNVIDNGLYLEFPFRLEVSGHYREVVNFIERLEKLPALSELRTITIKHCGIDASAKKKENAQVEIAPASDGTVIAVFNLVIYTSPAPEEQLKIEQVFSWATGRYNAFQVSDPVSPYPGVEPLVKKPDVFLDSVYSSVYD